MLLTTLDELNINHHNWNIYRISVCFLQCGDSLWFSKISFIPVQCIALKIKPRCLLGAGEGQVQARNKAHVPVTVIPAYWHQLPKGRVDSPATESFKLRLDDWTCLRKLLASCRCSPDNHTCFCTLKHLMLPRSESFGSTFPSALLSTQCWTVAAMRASKVRELDRDSDDQTDFFWWLRLGSLPLSKSNPACQYTE